MSSKPKASKKRPAAAAGGGRGSGSSSGKGGGSAAAASPAASAVVPSKADKKPSGPAAAWSDSDDDDVVVDLAAKSRLRKLRKTEEEEGVDGTDFAGRLRKRFVESSAPAEWASLKSTRAGDGVTHTGALVATSTALPRDEIAVTRQRDANHADPCKAVVQSVQFHPSGQLLLTAGFDQRIRLFQVRLCTNGMVYHRAVVCKYVIHTCVGGACRVAALTYTPAPPRWMWSSLWLSVWGDQVDGTKNTKLQSVYIENFPIRTAQFTADGEQVRLCRLLCPTPASTLC